MNWHEFLDDDARELATLYVLGALDAEAARRYRLHLPNCGVCAAEVASLAATAARLMEAAPTMPPPPELWQRVLTRIRDDPWRTRAGHVRPEQVWKEWTGPTGVGQDGLSYSRGSAQAFESTGIAGIEVRRLAVDPEREQVTMLVRMAPGTAYPAHRHGGAEECFVLEGELHVGDLHMKAGDFQRAERGSRHPVQTTDTGCLLLIVSSTRDEID